MKNIILSIKQIIEQNLFRKFYQKPLSDACTIKYLITLIVYYRKYKMWIQERLYFLIVMIEKGRRNLDKSDSNCKAFDRIVHDFLIAKLVT